MDDHHSILINTHAIEHLGVVLEFANARADDRLTRRAQLSELTGMRC